ncbi:MAG: 2-oxoglutarate dehydrogenase, E2 component, dihydrolipoamide succinyltransferase [Actinomycetota bacterium]
MPTTVTMPQLGETVVEGTILKWLKGEGDTIDRDEPLFEISTDKVDTEVPSPVAGTITKIKVAEGETVSVGTELAEIDDGSEGQKKVEVGDEGASEPDRASAEEAVAREVAQQPEKPAAETEKEMQPAARSGGVATRERAPAPDGDGQGARSNILSPLVRKLAEEHQIDLGRVQGTGTGGRITKKDVLAYIESGGAEAERGVPTGFPEPGEPARPQLEAVPERRVEGPREEVVPMTHIRKAIAKHMVGSLQTSARAWNLVEVNMQNIARLREGAKDAFKAREGFSLTYLPFVSRAVCEALLAFPDVNGELRGEEIVLKRYVNLGIAVAYEEGLIVPVVHGADEMNLVGVARAVNDLAQRARSKKLKPDEVHGGTFTITNPGPFGSIMSVPIINQPQTAILALDAVEKRPVVIDDAIAIRQMVYLSMSWDHRVIDGAAAAQFLGRLKRNLETWDFTMELQGYLPR